MEPQDLRLVHDISVLVARLHKALDRHKKRKYERPGYEEASHNFSISTISRRDSIQLQSEKRQAIRDYSQALAFHPEFSSRPLISSTPKHEVERGFSKKSVFTVSRHQSKKMKELSLHDVTSMDRLREIYEYWYYRRKQALQNLVLSRQRFIEAIEQMRRQTLEMEQLDVTLRPFLSGNENTSQPNDISGDHKSQTSQSQEMPLI